MKNFIKIALLVLILAPSHLLAQKGSGSKSQAVYEKKQEQRAKDKVKAEKAGRKRHMKLQTKEVRKRMKKAQRKSNKTTEKGRSNFISRWFGGRRMERSNR